MGNIIVMSVLVLAVILAVRHIHRQAKHGGCPGGCAGCGEGGHCPSQKKS